MFNMDRMRGEISIGAILRGDLNFGLKKTYIDDTQRIVRPIKSWLIIPKNDKTAISRPRIIPRSPHKISIFLRYGSKEALPTIINHHLPHVRPPSVDILRIIWYTLLTVYSNNNLEFPDHLSFVTVWATPEGTHTNMQDRYNRVSGWNRKMNLIGQVMGACLSNMPSIHLSGIHSKGPERHLYLSIVSL